jgi:outer membrane lipoprotein-sorting protein
VSDGATLWTFDPALGEAQRFQATEDLLEGAAVQFLLGGGQILREFDVSGGPCEASPVPLALVPREPASFARLELGVDAASGQILETRLFDLFGNVTHIRFRDIRTDVRPPPDTFRFEPPPGVRVLDAERQP